MGGEEKKYIFIIQLFPKNPSYFLYLRTVFLGERDVNIFQFFCFFILFFFFFFLFFRAILAAYGSS